MYRTERGRAQGRARSSVHAIAVLVAVLIVAALPQAASADDGPTGTGTIRGTVTDITGAPVAGATVTGWNDDGSVTDTTDAAGTYELTGPAPFSYTLQVEAEGFLEQYHGGYDWSRAERIDLEPGEIVDGTDVTVHRGATLSGTVTGVDGQPLEGIDVSAYGDSAGGGAITDAAGAYTIEGLHPADYRVYFSAEGYGWTYYGGARTAAQSELVTVESGAAVTGIDMTLHTASSISGRVTDEAGHPAAGVHINVLLEDWDGWAVTDVDGRYTVDDVFPGTYIIRAGRSGWPARYAPNVDSIDDAVPFVVAPGERATGADVVLPTGATISGTVVDEAGEPLAGATVLAYANSSNHETTTAADGTYVIRGLVEDTYTVWIGKPDYLWVYWGGDHEHDTAVPIAVSGNDVASGKDVTLPRGGSISGVVTDARGNPFEGVEVLISGDTIAYVTTGEDGRFSTSGLRNGVYHLRGQAPNGEEEVYGGGSEWDDAIPIEITGYASIEGIEIVWPGANVSGKVTDAAGAPLAGATVRAVPTGKTGPVLATTTTDTDGTYSIDGLPSRDLDVSAAAEGYLTTTRTPAVEASSWDDQTDIDIALPYEADLVLKATPPTGQVRAGDVFAYQLTVDAVAPSVAGPVTLTDTVAEGFELVSVKRGWFGVPCPITGRSFTCAINPAPSTSSFVVVSVRATRTGTTTLNDAGVTGRAPDRDAASNRASVKVTVVDADAQVDLALSSTVSSGTVHIGERFTQVFAVENKASVTATGVVVSGEVPAEVELRSATRGWFSQPCTVQGRRFSCAIAEVGDPTFVTLTLQAVAAGEVSSSATVDADQSDSDPTSDTAGTSVTIDPSAAAPDLETTVHGPTSVAVGDRFVLQVTATNVGAGAATGVEITADVPAGFEIEGAARGWFSLPCTVAGSTVRCAVDSIATNNFVQLRLRATTAGDFTVAATATSDDDVDEANDHASHPITVT